MADDSVISNSNFGNSSFVILAGGRASRMRASGSSSVSSSVSSIASSLDSNTLDKCLLSVGGKTILERIVWRLSSSDFSSSALNANGELSRFTELSHQYGLDLVRDLPPSVEDTASPSSPSPEQSCNSLLGPLAGLLSSLRWARSCGSRWLLTVPGDCPFLPRDLFSRLSSCQSSSGSLITCASSRQGNGDLRRHPVTALWDTSLHDDLATSLFSEGVRKIDLWTSRHTIAIEEWDSPLDFFFNVNDRADLARANFLARTDFR